MTRPLIAGEAKDIAQQLPEDAWHPLFAGTGTRGDATTGPIAPWLIWTPENSVAPKPDHGHAGC